jgi:hypothetical protein
MIYDFEYPELIPNFFDDDFEYGDPVQYFDDEDPDLGISDDNWACGTLNVEDECW